MVCPRLKLRQRWRRALLSCSLSACGGLPASAQTAEEIEVAAESASESWVIDPVLEPVIEVIDGMVLIDGIPEGYMVIEEDIIVPEDFYDMRAVFTSELWPGGIVPFRFDANVSMANQTLMLNAMTLWENVAAVDFRPRNGESDFVHIRDSSGDMNPANNSFVGPQGGQQIINITSWGAQFVIAHELGHCLGYWHEQSAPNRDDFVQVNYGNICQNCCGGGPCDSQFDIRDGSWVYGPYDFDSVMHYRQCDFSCCNANSNPCQPLTCFSNLNICRTITVLPPNDVQWQGNIGQRTHLSYWDMRVMSFMYPQWNWRFVDQTWNGDESGTLFEPWNTLSEVMNDVPDGGTVWFRIGDHYSAVGTYTRPMTFDVGLDAVTLGN